MPGHFTKLILRHISDTRYTPKSAKQIARNLKVPEDSFEQFQEEIDELKNDGKIIIDNSRAISLPPPAKQVVGKFRRHERGFGFITPEKLSAYGDLFVPPGKTGDALSGDKVLAKVFYEKRRTQGNGSGKAKSPYTASIIKILERADRPFTGTLIKKSGLFVVDVDGGELPDPVVIKDAQTKGAKSGQKVAIELVHFSDGGNDLPQGVITKILGEAGEVDVETKAVMHAFGLEEEFDKAALKEARAIAKKFDKVQSKDDQELNRREDITGLFTCTIDPDDSKDFDDAITVRKLKSDKNGGVYELGVHIADVSYFVEPNSAIDKQAYGRANSTYLPQLVIPMLPEVLSNGVCSLQEGVSRFCKSCFIKLDKKGKPLSVRFANTIIKSDKRLTYREAQALIDGRPKQAKKYSKTDVPYSKKLKETLKLMDELARIIQKRREDDGMLHLDLPEVALIFDEGGKVIDAQPEDDSFTHTIIEMFMVEANEAAARTFDNLDIPMIRRIHPDPDSHDTKDLKHFARIAGYNIPSNPSKKQLQELLASVRGKPAEHAVNMAVLKTLARAEYSPLLIGHFALASKHYTHFTSPIRRYADLVVHRGISALIEANKEGGRDARPTNARPTSSSKSKKQLTKKIIKDPRLPDEDKLDEISVHCSDSQRNSDGAEKSLRTFLVLQLLKEKLGEDYQGVVTGVNKKGIFVELDKFCIEGFVPISKMPGKKDSWKLDSRASALVAKKSKHTISIGRRLKVRIMSVDLTRRYMELAAREK